MHLNLVDAFDRFGARPSNRLRGRSALAADGALVLNCSQATFGHPARGVLRYEDKLSREPADTKDVVLLGQHLALARDGELPIRMVVPCRADANARRSQGFHVRPDLIGKIVKFDGDHFIIDFTRQEPVREVSSRRK
ncbi:MAG TPA: hypothetical protein VIY54_13715 [Steroidobacteraceae bacterium]